MIIKSLSRQSGGTGQLFNYLFRYMLQEEKAKTVPPHVSHFIEKAEKFKTAKEFEKALKDEELLKFQCTLKYAPGIVNSPGIFGNGIHLVDKVPSSKAIPSKDHEVKKYLISPEIKLFNAGKNGMEYTKLQERILKDSGLKIDNLEDREKVNQLIQEQLEKEGYSGIKAKNETILFKENGITQLTKDFFKDAKRQNKEHAVTQGMKQPQFVVTHNIKSKTISGYVKEFEMNESLRIHKRKDNIAVYHTILSFSNKDKEKINEKILKDVTSKFIELRGKDNLYVFTSHHDKEHIHLHCAISGTKLNGMSSRVSKSDFANIKLNLDSYLKREHKEILHSFPNHGKSKQIEAREAEKNVKRLERSSDLSLISKVLDEVFAKSSSPENFYSQLTALGHPVYYRAGKATGVNVNGNKKFRLGKLGFDEKKLAELQKQKNPNDRSLKELQELRSGRGQKRELINPTPIEERMKNLNTDKSKVEKENPKENTLPKNDDRARQELHAIRESKAKENERSDSKEDSGRDMADEKSSSSKGPGNNNSNDKGSEDDNSNDNNDNSPAPDTSNQIDPFRPM